MKKRKSCLKMHDIIRLTPEGKWAVIQSISLQLMMAAEGWGNKRREDVVG